MQNLNIANTYEYSLLALEAASIADNGLSYPIQT